MSNILYLIELKQKELNTAVSKYGLSNSTVLALSQELDKLLNEQMRLEKDNAHTPKTCGITGLRPHKLIWKYNEAHPNCIKLKKIIRDELLKFIINGGDTMNTGLAQGVDLIFSSIVLDLKSIYPHIKLIGYCPFAKQAEKWNIEQRTKYNSILKSCDDVITMHSEFTTHCYKKRNEMLVKSSDCLIAVTNNKNLLRSGTTMTINMAKKLNKKILIINPNDHSVEEL